MNDVIKKLVDIDEKAKKYNEQTQLEKDKLEAEIEKETERILERYMADAKSEVEAQKKSIDAECEAKFEKTEALRKEQTEALKKKFDENSDKWVEQIVSEVIGE